MFFRKRPWMELKLKMNMRWWLLHRHNWKTWTKAWKWILVSCGPSDLPSPQPQRAIKQTVCAYLLIVIFLFICWMFVSSSLWISSDMYCKIVYFLFLNLLAWRWTLLLLNLCEGDTIVTWSVMKVVRVYLLFVAPHNSNSNVRNLGLRLCIVKDRMR